MKFNFIKILLVLCVLSVGLFLTSCELKQNEEIADDKVQVSTADSVDKEYKAYLATFVEFENVGNLIFDENTLLREEYSVGENVVLPNVILPNGNERVFVQKLDNGVVTLYKSFNPLKKGDAVVFEESGEYVICFVQENNDAVYNKNFTVSVVKKKAFDFSSFPQTMSINEKLNFGKVLFNNEGILSAADVYCISPLGDGVDVSEGVFIPNVVGDYKFTAMAINGQYKDTVTVTVVGDTSKLFASDVVEVSSNYDLPSWSVPGNGVLLATEVRNATARYTNVIDLSAITSDIPLIEFQVMYGNDGNYNFTDMGIIYLQSGYFKVRLVDIYDPNIKVEFAWRSNEWYYYPSMSKGDSLLLTAPKDFDMAKWYTGNGYAELGRYTFLGSEGIENNAQLFNVAYDYEENSSYYFNMGAKKFFSNYASTDLWGGNAFEKFTTGEVYLEIVFGDYDTMRGIVVTSVAGNSLSGNSVSDLDNVDEDSFIDSGKPTYKFNVDNEFLSNMPDGYINVKYPIPECYVIDTIAGERAVKTLVRNDSTGKTYSVNDGYFIPEEAGIFSIIYSTVDGYGEVLNKVVKIEVINSDVPLIEFAFENIPTAKKGMNYQIPKINVSGGSGKVDYDYKIFYNGKEVFADIFNRVYLDDAGELKFIFEAKDYLGTEILNNEFVIDVYIASDAYINVSESVPKYVRFGSTIVFPSYDVVCYGANISDKYIEVNGVRLSDNRKYFVIDDVG